MLTVTLKNHAYDNQLCMEDEEYFNSYTAIVITESKDHQKYAASRKKEIEGLINRGIFTPASVEQAQ